MGGEDPRLHPHARPEPSDLVTAAEALRKTGLGKLFASLGGKLKAARAVAAHLGAAAEPDGLEALAEHVAAVRAFEADERLSAPLGPAWSGLRTPFDDVKAWNGRCPNSQDSARPFRRWKSKADPGIPRIAPHGLPRVKARDKCQRH